MVTLKHKKNLDIIALSTVCKSWHQHITGSKILFRDIAFDISCEESIVTAGVFLKVLEGTQIPVNVYAHLGENTSDPMIMKLLALLRPHIEHMVRFNYCGNMNAYRSYFNIPAPNLLYFSDCFDMYPGRGPPLFCGQTPRLRALTTVSQVDKIDGRLRHYRTSQFSTLRLRAWGLYSLYAHSLSYYRDLRV